MKMKDVSHRIFLGGRPQQQNSIFIENIQNTQLRKTSAFVLIT